MAYEVELEPGVLKRLRGIREVDRVRIAKKIKGLREDPRPAGVEKLTGVAGWRIRSGDYRNVYRIDDPLRLVIVTRVSHRSDVTGGARSVEQLVQLTEARTRFSEFVRLAQEQVIWVLRHGRPAVVLVSPKQYEALLNEIEDLRDRLSIYESEEAPSDLRVPWEKAEIELGLT